MVSGYIASLVDTRWAFIFELLPVAASLATSFAKF